MSTFHEHRDSAYTVDVLDQARAWILEDPDPETRAELQALVDAGELMAVGERFSGRLEFGTAGLRGALGAGPMRMNRVVVIRAAAGLSAYVLVRGGGSVVIGYDARRNSDVFARDTADVVTGAGLSAFLLPRRLPTPVLAFAIRHLGASAGVMVTASHNPATDNGYKVYLGDGSQIVPPADVEISAAIDGVGPVTTIARKDGARVLGEEVLDAYLAAVAAVPSAGGPRDLRVVYTPLHGVGGDVLLAAFGRAGFPAPRVVLEQAQPDPGFPTVAFPNPEEPGAIDLALAEAALQGADIVIANDPDADRCAVAVPSPDGTWRMLTGDELGSLLGEEIARRGPGPDAVFACSIVSSRLLGRIAAAHGLRHVETLTGFKWIARVDDLAFGYEEALGYCVDPQSVRDKDGISAALLVAELAAALKVQGRTLLDALDDLARSYGLHATDQLALRVDDLSLITDAMARLRASPPAQLGGLDVLRIDDLEHPGSEPGALPPTDGLRYFLAEDARVVVRPSGTEPKLKCYLEVVIPADAVTSAPDLATVRRTAADRLARIKADLHKHLH